MCQTNSIDDLQSMKYEIDWNSMCEAKRLRRATSKAARDDVWTRAQPTIILPDHHRSSISCKRNSTNFGIFPAQCFPVWNWNWTWQEAIVQQGLKPPKALEDLFARLDSPRFFQSTIDEKYWYISTIDMSDYILAWFIYQIIDVFDWASWVAADPKALLFTLTQVVFEDILQAIDCNGSGSLDYTEFLAAMLDQKVYMQRDCCGQHQHCINLPKGCNKMQ